MQITIEKIWLFKIYYCLKIFITKEKKKRLDRRGGRPYLRTYELELFVRLKDGPMGREEGREVCRAIFLNKILIDKNIRPTGLLRCHVAV